VKNSNQTGFTLVELIASMAIASIVLFGMLGFLVTSMVNNSVRTAKADLLREAQLALDVIVKDIRLSAVVDSNNRIEDNNSPDAVATAGLGWESDSETLVLAIAAEDTSSNIIFADAAHYITEKNNIIYYVDNAKLYKRTLAADLPDNDFITSCPPNLAIPSCPADRLSIENVQSLVFRYFDALNNEVDPASARSVEVELRLQAEKYGRLVDVSYKTRTVFRNE
jgi:prepilin-type N-terminal cleavage/methylation domain-containing protein